MMYRRLFAVLSAILMIALLAACTQTGSSSAPPSGPASAGASSDAASEPAPLEPATVSWLITRNEWRDHDMVTEAVNQLLSEKYADLNLTLDFQWYDWGTYVDRVNIMLQANETFDVMFTSQWWNSFPALANRGDLAPLDDLLAEYGQDITRQVNEVYFQAMSRDGQIYGVPNVQGFSQGKGLTFNADLVDKYEFDYKSVKNLADIEDYLQTILANEPGITPFLPGTGVGDLLPPQEGDPEPVDWMLYYDTAENTLTPALTAERDLTYYRFIRDWYNKGYIARDAASKVVWGDEIRTGQYAVMPNFAFVNDGAANTAAYGFRVYDIQLYASSPIRTADIQNSAVGISRTSTHPDRAMQLINTVWADQEIFNTMTFGVEGTHWNWLDESQLLIETTEEFDVGYGEPNNYMIAGIVNLYGRESYPRAQIEAELANNDVVPPSYLMGFVYDASAVETEMAAFNAIWAEVQYLLGTGTVDPDVEIPVIMDRLNTAGYPALTEHLQGQIDEWKAANGK